MNTDELKFKFLENGSSEAAGYEISAGSKKLNNVKVFEQDINGISFSAMAEVELQSQILTLFQIITEIPSQNIKDGFVIEAGFSLFTLFGTDKAYRIKVQDYTKNPFSDTTDDLTVALRIQSEQLYLLRKYGIAGESVRFDEKILTVKGALSEKMIFMQRSGDCKKGDSGWCIRSAEDTDEHDEPSEYEAIYAFQLLKLRPAIIKVLPLPYEYIAVFDGEYIEAILNENDENLIQ